MKPPLQLAVAAVTHPFLVHAAPSGASGHPSGLVLARKPCMKARGQPRPMAKHVSGVSLLAHAFQKRTAMARAIG